MNWAEAFALVGVVWAVVTVLILSMIGGFWKS